MRAAIERIFAQYTRFDIRVLAVRGQRSHLVWTRWSDDDGNETTTFYVNETGDDGRLNYHGRFDEDDFEGAYREFEQTLSRGRGRGVRRSGLRSRWNGLSRSTEATWTGRSASSWLPARTVENRSRSAFPDPSVSDLAHELQRPECDGCVDADVAVGAVLAAARLVRCPSRARGRWARRRDVRVDVAHRERPFAMGGSCPSAFSTLRTRKPRSPTPRSGCGRPEPARSHQPSQRQLR